MYTVKLRFRFIFSHPLHIYVQGFIEVMSASPNAAHISGCETLLHQHVCLGMDFSYGFNVLCVFAQFLHIFCQNFNKLRLPWSGAAAAIAVRYVAHLQSLRALQMRSSTLCRCWRTCPAVMPTVGRDTDPSRQHFLCPRAPQPASCRQNPVPPLPVPAAPRCLEQ